MKRNLKLFLIVCFLPLSSLTFAAAPICYRLALAPEIRTPRGETMCLGLEDSEQNIYSISFYSGNNDIRKVVASFHLPLKSRARCYDCNQDVFSETTNSASPFNIFSVQFNGVRKPLTDNSYIKESGYVTIGNQKLYYFGPVQELY